MSDIPKLLDFGELFKIVLPIAAIESSCVFSHVFEQRKSPQLPFKITGMQAARRPDGENTVTLEISARRAMHMPDLSQFSTEELERGQRVMQELIERQLFAATVASLVPEPREQALAAAKAEIEKYLQQRFEHYEPEPMRLRHMWGPGVLRDYGWPGYDSSSYSLWMGADPGIGDSTIWHPTKKLRPSRRDKRRAKKRKSK